MEGPSGSDSAAVAGLGPKAGTKTARRGSEGEITTGMDCNPGSHEDAVNLMMNIHVEATHRRAVLLVGQGSENSDETRTVDRY
jgi:hypothetical protein